MSFKEKSAWIMAVIAAVVYFIYLSSVLGRADGMPLTEVAYVATLLWTIGLMIVASIVMHIMVAIAAPAEADKQDQRDKEIHRYGEYIGQWLVVAGALAAMLMSLAEIQHFWIANTIYLAFVLSTLIGSGAKIVAYRRGF